MNFFEDVPGSITSFEFYTSKVNQRSWDTFKYLFLLVLVVGIGLATQFYVEANNGLGVLITDLRVGAPDFLLDNGRLQVAGSQPYRWEEGGSLFLIDTRGPACRRWPIRISGTLPSTRLTLWPCFPTSNGLFFSLRS